MLTIGSLRSILAAALDEPDGRIAPMIDALQCAGLLPRDEHAALDTANAASVMLALVANIPASRVADEGEELGPLPEPEADNDNIGAWAPIALPTPRAWN